MTDQLASPKSVELAASIVSSFVGHNSVPTAELPTLIANVHAAVENLGKPPLQQEPEKLTPPVSIKKSITSEYLISLEDGKQYRSLKRHLTGRGLTPEQYRKKWGLPRDYPMVAPSYSAQRSELARSFGLGQKRKEAAKSATIVGLAIFSPASSTGPNPSKRPEPLPIAGALR